MAQMNQADFEVMFQKWAEIVRMKIEAYESCGFLRYIPRKAVRERYIPRKAVRERRLKSLELLKLVIDNGEFEENAELDLSDLFIESWIIQEFGFNLKNIKALNLSRNLITSLPHDLLYQCNNIQTLNLSRNRITSLPHDFLYQCKNIQTLNLSSNKITSLPNDFLIECKNIQELHLYGNEIASLPSSFKQLNDNLRIMLYENPLVFPPLDVCKEGIHAIKRYFEDIEKSREVERKTLLGDSLAASIKADVIFPYDARREDELSFAFGDIITNINMQDEGWWEGELDGKRGVFPENSVKLFKLFTETVKFQKWEEKVRKKIKANESRIPPLFLSEHEVKAEKERRLKSLELLKLMIDNGEFEENSELDLRDLFIESWIIQEFGLNLKNIKALNLSFNRITSLPHDFLYQCKNIETLDLSWNEIASLPDDFLYQCKNIQTLDLSRNEIASLPDDFLYQCKNIETLDLSWNEIASLPGDFLYQCKNIQTLDLSWNKIASLPRSFKQLNDNVGIDLSGNHLVSPPLEVCERGIRAIKRYFEDIEKSGGGERKRVKVILLGDTLAGKTSLARALTHGKAVKNSGEDDRTIQLEMSSAIMRQFETKIIDCGGQNKYLLSHQLFVSNGMVCLLLFDMIKYNAENDYKIKIGNWITMVNAHAPGTPFFIVGTHLDEVSQENRQLKDENCKNVLTDLEDHIERIKEYSGNPPVLLNDSIIEISAIGKLEGVNLLKEKLLEVIGNKDICPLVHQYVPNSWSQLEAELGKLNETHKNNNQIPVIELDYLISMANDKFKLEAESIKTALCYFHACSSILYFSNIEKAKNLVFADPDWLVDILKLLYRHDLEKKLNYREQSKDAMNKLCVSKRDFNKWKTMLSKGIIEEQLLNLLFYPVSSILDEIICILENFDFLCSIKMKEHSEEKLFFTPWFLSEIIVDSKITGWDQYLETDDVIIIAEAMPLVPDGIFLRYLTHVYRKSKFCYPWLTGIVAENDNGVLLRVEISDEEIASTVKFHVRANLHCKDQLILATREYVEDFCSLVKECPGIRKLNIDSICSKCPDKDYGYKEVSRLENCCFDWNDFAEEKCEKNKSHVFLVPLQSTKRKVLTVEEQQDPRPASCSEIQSKPSEHSMPVEHSETGKVFVVHSDGKITHEPKEQEDEKVENNKAKESNEADVSQAPMIYPSDKIALVIGNQNYQKDRYDNLALALNDAFSIASALEKLGFKVISLNDLTLKEMRAAMLAFSRLLGFGVFAVFYYAGHGFELEGENYLMPVDIQNSNRGSCIRAQEYLQEMQNCNTFLNLVILDCCRSSTKTSDVAPKPSLKRFQKGNTIIAYACCTQHRAKEEPREKNGLYTKYLLKHIHRDTRIENILMDVNRDVVACHPHMQRPTFESDTGYDCRLTAQIKPDMRDPLERERLLLWQEGSQIPAPMKLNLAKFVITLKFLPAFSNLMHISVEATGKNPHMIKNLRFIASAFPPLSVVQDTKTLELNPEDERIELGFIRVFKLQKLYNETVFLSIEFKTAEESIIKKIDLGTPLISGITSKFDEWAKDRQ